MRNYTENADSLLEQYPTKTVPLSKQEEKRIYDMALKKIEKAGSYTPPKLKKHRRVPVCVAAAVAATCVLSQACQAAPYIQGTGRRENRFFHRAKSRAGAKRAGRPARRVRRAASDTEAHNTEIGQTQTLDGVNYTLDTVSMDAATLDCFFTVSGENVVSKFLDTDSIYPEWEQLAAIRRGWRRKSTAARKFTRCKVISTDRATIPSGCGCTISCRKSRRAIPLCCACSIPTLLRANRDLATQWS